MQYYTYWSILDQTKNNISNDSILLTMLLIAFISVLLVLKFKTFGFEKKIILSITSLFLILSFSGYIHLKFFVRDSTKERLTKFLDSNQIKKIEGKISKFKRIVPNPRSGKTTTESFMVDPIKFEYYDNALYKFNHFGGNHSKYLHDGLEVRITYTKDNLRNEIQKLEIRKK